MPEAPTPVSDINTTETTTIVVSPDVVDLEPASAPTWPKIALNRALRDVEQMQDSY